MAIIKVNLFMSILEITTFQLRDSKGRVTRKTKFIFILGSAVMLLIGGLILWLSLQDTSLAGMLLAFGFILFGLASAVALHLFTRAATLPLTGTPRFILLGMFVAAFALWVPSLVEAVPGFEFPRDAWIFVVPILIVLNYFLHRKNRKTGK